MEIGHIIPHIEALVFASDKPLTPIDITDLINNAFGFMDDKISMEQVQSAIEGIVEKYHSEFYPFEMKESGGGWQFLTKKEYHKTVAQLNGEKFLKRLSIAALETLAIIAYKQPLSKSDIESIRGVNCDYSIQKLLEKELIIISGRNEEMPGKPLIYVTSRTFMDYFGINSPQDLPKLKEIFDEAMIPTAITPGEQDQQIDSSEVTEEELAAAPPLVVTETGELLVGSDNTEEELLDKETITEPIAENSETPEEQSPPGQDPADETAPAGDSPSTPDPEPSPDAEDQEEEAPGNGEKP